MGLVRKLLAALLLAASSPAAASAAADAFARLQALVGTWRGTFPDGRAHSVSYRLTAAGSVLVETWALSPGRESMTLYHVDGDRLLATHYCPQGTQPRLALVRPSAPGRLDFAFVDGTGLSVPGRSHQRAFLIEPRGRDSFARAEAYVANDAPPGPAPTADEIVVYSRTPG